MAVASSHSRATGSAGTPSAAATRAGSMPGPSAAAVARMSSAVGVPSPVSVLPVLASPSLATWRRTACRMPAGTGTSSTAAAPGPSRRATWDTNNGLPSLRRWTTASTSASAPGSMSWMSPAERPARTSGGLADSSAAITSLTSGSRAASAVR